jgi:hypothetical protein
MSRKLTLDDLEQLRQKLEEHQVPGPYRLWAPGMEEPEPLEEFNLQRYLLEQERP